MSDSALAGEPPRTAWFQRPLIVDAIVVAALAAMSLWWGSAAFFGEKAIMIFGDDWPAAVAKWWVTAGIALGALLVRRRFPLFVLLVTVAVTGCHMADGWAALPADAAAPLALFSVVVRRSRRISAAVVAGGLVASLGWAVYVGQRNASPPKAAFEGTVRLKPAGIPAGRKAVPVGKSVIPADTPPKGGHPTPVLGIYRPPTAWGGFPVLALVIGLAWLAGENSRHRHAHLAALEQRAADLERARAREAELARAAERARISRELHDVVAHGLSVIVIQAQGGAAELAGRPQRTREALEAIVTTGRQSLAEMRRLLGVLRDPADRSPRLEPQARLADLPRLVDRLRRAGMRVDLDCGDLPPDLPVAVELSAYRSVQEALTNVAKHAGPGAAATVRLRHENGGLVIEVTDDGAGRGPADRRHVVHRPGAAARRVGPDLGPGEPGGPGVVDGDRHGSADGGGHGLRGMRERVTLLGGDLRAGVRPEGGFEVRVRLPTGAMPV